MLSAAPRRASPARIPAPNSLPLPRSGRGCREAAGEGRGILGSVPNKNARDMRKAPTQEEARVWKWLRDRRFGGHKFRRQPIGTYVVDFYSIELRLVIELDGRHHDTTWMAPYDDERTAALNRLGIEVLRIPNEMFKQDVELVAESIKWAMTAASRPSPGLRPPSPA